MHHSFDGTGQREAGAMTRAMAEGPRFHIECQPRDGAVTFRCESCSHEMNDLRGVFLSHRGAAGWLIECASHADGDRSMDAGHLFGGGLRSVELFADLARASWFDARDLFDALTRLRAQARGVYRCAIAPRTQFR
jgi:hypothetical protein